MSGGKSLGGELREGSSEQDAERSESGPYQVTEQRVGNSQADRINEPLEGGSEDGRSQLRSGFLNQSQLGSEHMSAVMEEVAPMGV